MAEYFNTWDDGQQKWVKKINSFLRRSETEYDFKNILPYNLIACDIKSEVINSSWVIIHNEVLLRSYENNSINYWVTKNNIITLYFKDNTYFQLLFITPSEAILADLRLYLIMNGNIIVDCNDTDIYTCSNITNLNLNMCENCSEILGLTINF